MLLIKYSLCWFMTTVSYTLKINLFYDIFLEQYFSSLLVWRCKNKKIIEFRYKVLFRNGVERLAKIIYWVTGEDKGIEKWPA